jgi:hypothetical protein
MQLHKYRDFGQSLNLLYKRGGKYQKAAESVYAALGLAESGEAPSAALPLTNFGESRLRHCVKYDLTGYCRLITVQTNGYCILLYCGTHDDLRGLARAQSWTRPRGNLWQYRHSDFRLQ